MASPSSPRTDSGGPARPASAAVRLRPLEITVLRHPLGVRLRGEVDLATVPRLEPVLELLLDAPGDVVVDLGGVTFLDVGGGRALARTALLLRPTGRQVHLRAASPFVCRVLFLLGWADLFVLPEPA
ncbi:STAS domain-containing protein [Paractinoplanes atraurantiacus]|uniref:Anti-anti-sigma factor n=1 Tax=Paractinoplanes atraurantiacus TaxID=1036182 RepID=A0A285J2P5_9ACTN|nr:STAS domain-containing protein [Actinoplanes atraurantiacus]SNY53636.1 anti-anti-sigma factor [Actinoplanes atraurantiacus]